VKKGPGGEDGERHAGGGCRREGKRINYCTLRTINGHGNVCKVEFEHHFSVEVGDVKKLSLDWARDKEKEAKET